MDNLINNALKFTPAGGQVTVKTTSKHSADGQTITVAIEDTGFGIKPEALGKIFQPFKQANIKTSRKFGGTGLGLPITRKLCRLMDGDVLVRSEFGKGTVFSMSFEAEIAEDISVPALARDRTTVAPEIIMKLKGLSCLIVEDNEVNLEVLRVLLEPFEFNFTESANGAEAVFALENQNFDFVLMDLQMPVMGGIEAMEAIRNSGKAYSNIPIVVMTANAMTEDRMKSFEVGADAFLAKPLGRADLAHVINSTLFPNNQVQKSVA
jgi:hypothetical protein